MKKYIFVLIVLLIITLSGCKKVETLTYDKDSPTTISIEYKGSANYMIITGDDFSQEWTDLSDLASSGKLIFPANFFLNFYSGEYTIKVADLENINTYSITIKGYNKNFNYITKEDVFEIDEEKFFVLITKDSCSGCETLKPDSYVFNDFLLSHDSPFINNLYVIDGSASSYVPSEGENEDLTGISDYASFISDAKIYTPTLMVVENNVITSYYTGAAPVADFFNTEITRIKNVEIKDFVIEDPKGFSVEINFVPTKFSVKGLDVDNSYNAGSHYSEGSTYFTFAADFFSTYLPGTYSLVIYNEENQSKEVEVNIKGSFNYILKDNVFDITDEVYYVFFLKTGCPGCNSVKPTLIKYNNYCKLTEATPIYAVHRSMNSSFNTSGEENTIGVSQVEDLSITSVPRVLLIKNGVVTAAYNLTAETNILTIFEDLMK